MVLLRFPFATKGALKYTEGDTAQLNEQLQFIPTGAKGIRAKLPKIDIPKTEQVKIANLFKPSVRKPGWD